MNYACFVFCFGFRFINNNNNNNNNNACKIDSPFMNVSVEQHRANYKTSTK